MHEITGKSFSMYPFSASYNSMQYLKVSTCLTSYIYEYGQTWIIVFDKVIWFSIIMDHLLVNPNQIRMSGIPVSEYPFGNNRNLCIAHEKLLIPFSTDGTTVYFNSRFPNYC